MAAHQEAHIGVWVAQGQKAAESLLKFWTPVYEHHTGRAITELWRIQFWAQDQASMGSLPSGMIPAEYGRIRLYHVRKKRCVLADQTVRRQGIRGGDVLVLLSSDEMALEMNLSLLLSENWPPHISERLALTSNSLRLGDIPPAGAGAVSDLVEAKVGFGGFKIDLKKLWALVRSKVGYGS